MTEEKPKQITRIEYIGKGRFVYGVPARDLTLDEWKKLPLKRQKHVIKLGLYEVKYD